MSRESFGTRKCIDEKKKNQGMLKEKSGVRKYLDRSNRNQEVSRWDSKEWD